MAFPNSPVDGQRYKQYVYDSTEGGWRLEPNFLDGMPVGIALPYFGTSIPAGWLRIPRNATRISRAQYAELWNALGNEDWFAPDSSAAGTADANGEFHLPTMADAYLREGIHGTVTSVDTTNNVITLDDEDGTELTGSDLRDGTPFRFRSTGSLPGGITDAYTTYYLFWDSGNSGWSLHTTEDNAINNTSETSLTSTGSGTITATQYGIDLADAMQQITGSIDQMWQASAAAATGAFDKTSSGSSKTTGSGGSDFDISFDSANSPGAKTSNESRGRTGYGRYIIKAESIVVNDSPASAFKYDTGWVANSDWTNAELVATHNLNISLSELIVKFFISTDGTDANSFELKDFSRIATTNTSNNTDDGFAVYQNSLNEVKIQTGNDGIIQISDTGGATRIDNESYYYRIVVYKPQFTFSNIQTVPIRTITSNYSIGVNDANVFSCDSSGGDFTISLPDSSNLNLGHEIQIVSIDSSVNSVIIGTQGSDITVGPGDTELTDKWSETTAKLVSNSTWLLVSGSGRNQGESTALLHIEDQKPNGTNGGDFNSGSWHTRDLNTAVTNTIVNASLSSNQFTLPAGTYEIEASAPAFRVDNHMARLQNITDGSTMIWGTTEFSDNIGGGGANDVVRSWVRGRFTINSSKTFEIQHRGATTNTSNGFGPNAGNGFTVDHETYTQVWLRQIESINIETVKKQYRLFHVEDQKPSGTDGGTFTSGAWQTRDLTTEVTNTVSNASLSNNQITLHPGTYEIDIRCPARIVNQHKARLQNITDGSTLLVGSNAYANANNAIDSESIIRGRVTLSATKTLEVQHRCLTTRNDDGFGAEVNSSFAVNHETYTQVWIMEVEDVVSQIYTEIEAESLKITNSQGNTLIDTQKANTAPVDVPDGDLQNGWVNFNSNQKFTKFLSSDGVLHATGRLTSGTTTGGTTIYTFPVSERPVNMAQAPAVEVGGNSALLQIQADGQVKIYDVASADIAFNFSFKVA